MVLLLVDVQTMLLNKYYNLKGATLVKYPKIRRNNTFDIMAKMCSIVLQRYTLKLAC